SHQIELAHCQYAAQVCRLMQGQRFHELSEIVSVAPEFRQFAEALLLLSHSHESWSQGRIGEASAQAEQAAQGFEKIRFGNYTKRARSLTSLLAAWRRLELGAPIENAVALAPDHAPIIRAMLGVEEARSALIKWIEENRPSKVLGMLQFASAYNS